MSVISDCLLNWDFSENAMASVREKIQQQRKELNKQIFKSHKTYQGAENLVKATESKEIKDRAALELSYIQSQWATLREKLQELNSNIDSYQNLDGNRMTFTMLAVGLKESVPLEKSAKLSFNEIILEHYGESPDQYKEELETLYTLRQKSLNPNRDEGGLKLLKEYFNHLFYVESRFFKSDSRSNGIHFSWFDCLAGTLHTQFSIDYEKACVLFNIGSLHSQIATRQDRSYCEGAEEALKHYQFAAGVFKFLGKFFINTPSSDLSEKCQEVLQLLMLSQAQECLYERIALTEHEEKANNSKLLDYLMSVVESYQKLDALMRLNSDVPQAWSVLVSAKYSHYSALAHFYAARIVQSVEAFPFDIYDQNIQSISMAAHVTRAYVDMAVDKHGEALRKVKSNRHLKHIDSLLEVLEHTQERSGKLQNSLTSKRGDDLSIDFFEIQPLSISGLSSKKVTEIEPDFENEEIEDIFAQLGPLNVFNAKNNWTTVAKFDLKRKSYGESFGFTVRGNVPVSVETVDKGGIAEKAGLKGGEVIVKVNGFDVKWAFHKEVVTLIKAAENNVTLHTVSLVNSDESKSLTL